MAQARHHERAFDLPAGSLSADGGIREGFDPRAATKAGRQVWAGGPALGGAGMIPKHYSLLWIEEFDRATEAKTRMCFLALGWVRFTTLPEMYFQESHGVIP